MASFQLPVKYPQLPALLVGQIETLTWGMKFRGVLVRSCIWKSYPGIPPLMVLLVVTSAARDMMDDLPVPGPPTSKYGAASLGLLM